MDASRLSRIIRGIGNNRATISDVFALAEALDRPVHSIVSYSDEAAVETRDAARVPPGRKATMQATVYKDVPSLVKELKLGSPSVRVQAARMLGEHGHQAEPALPDLVFALECRDAPLVEAALQSIETIAREMREEMERGFEQLQLDAVGADWPF